MFSPYTMNLQIKQSKYNTYPIQGILIKGPSPTYWIQEIERMGFLLSNIVVYPIPNTIPNSIWGCLLVSSKDLSKIEAGANQYCQCIHQRLFIPEKTSLFPSLTAKELDALLLSKPYVMHPDFGMVELFDPINWTTFIELPKARTPKIKRPASSIVIPQDIKTFQVYALSPEELLQQLESLNFSEGKPLDAPLNASEKARLFLLRRLFKQHEEGNTEKSSLMGALESFRNKISGTEGQTWSDALQKEYEALEKRNQKELDKLLDLLKNNPEEALKYAIPLDHTGMSRGSSYVGGTWSLSQRWDNFSLFGRQINATNLGGSAPLGDKGFYQLQEQYRETAVQLIQEKKYRKAAFIYLKLLKDYDKAAKTLEMGHFYQEAASVYLKHCNDKESAARCYHHGNMLPKAIELYKELQKYELVGDLYLELNKKEDALFYYDKVIEEHKQKGRYLKAAFLAQNKIENVARAQSLLLMGWQNKSDAFNCLNNYFKNIKDLATLKAAIASIYQYDVTPKNAPIFLRAIKCEFKKGNTLSPFIQTIAHEIISEQATFNPNIIQELVAFDKDNKNLSQDILRYSSKRR